MLFFQISFSNFFLSIFFQSNVCFSPMRPCLIENLVSFPIYFLILLYFSVCSHNIIHFVTGSEADLPTDLHSEITNTKMIIQCSVKYIYIYVHQGREIQLDIHQCLLALLLSYVYTYSVQNLLWPQQSSWICQAFQWYVWCWLYWMWMQLLLTMYFSLGDKVPLSVCRCCNSYHWSRSTARLNQRLQNVNWFTSRRVCLCHGNTGNFKSESDTGHVALV